MPIQYQIVSSLEKVFPDREPDFCEVPFTVLQNDVVSFQLALRIEGEAGASCKVRIAVDSPLADWLSVRRVELMPSSLPAGNPHDDNIISDEPGLYPDLLRPLTDRTDTLPCGAWTAFWVTVRTDEKTAAGVYPITIRVDADGEAAAAETEVEVIGAVLPRQRLLVTEWFHGDCVADYYHIPVFSETHWEYMRRQIAFGVRYGLNMILTPIFTPPLDTEVGGERTTIQLVDIGFQDGVYSFDFAKLGRWVKMCLDCGILYFEMAHLYTQHGAAHCPKIMVTENGILKKRFGWENDALGEEYRAFLRAFLPALTAELRRLGIHERTYFHISDEPNEACLPQYQAAREQVAELLRGFPIVDAMSDYRYFAEGICETPVVATDALEPFLSGRRPSDLWVYYCCAQRFRVSNRFFGMPSARNRIIGLQMYKYGVKGFLQWGFNFYNSYASKRHVDPFQVTDADGIFPSGDSFLVYPGPDGEPFGSIRMEVFYEALCDLRALLLLEQRSGKEHVMELMEAGLEEPITFTDYPTDAGYLLTVRSRLNREIAGRC